jgi:hypothetical protein
MEIESVMSYIASSVNPDGLRAEEIVEALEEDTSTTRKATGGSSRASSSECEADGLA